MSVKAGRSKTRILVADDEDVIRSLLKYNIEKQGWEMVEAANGREAIELVDDEITVALLDLKMPEASGMDVLQHLKRNHPGIPVVMISAVGQIHDAVQTIRNGAFDYISKPFDLDNLLAVLKRAVALGKARNEGRTLRTAISDIPSVVGFFGSSEASRRLMKQMEVIAPLESTVMITGENGTGKTLLARMIHKASQRARGPFITVSCPSLPRDLIEAELFGHEKGSFTGALARRLGRVEMADGGTLFLDEIGDLPLSLQPKLLNFLQDREFQRIGGHEILTADVRIIAATNVDLKKRIADSEFREDLYFRLNVMPLEVEPLRRRTHDLDGLCGHILESISAKRQAPLCTIAPETMAILCRYPWPGNVRELENVLERASAFCTDNLIRPNDLSRDVLESGRTTPESGKMAEVHHPAAESMSEPQLSGRSLAEIEKDAILRTLQHCDGNKAAAARILGISEKSIYNKLARYASEEKAVSSK
jgi:DNA-binding NtrC family response regulator